MNAAIIPVDDMRKFFEESVDERVKSWGADVQNVLKVKMDASHKRLESCYQEKLNKYEQQLNTVGKSKQTQEEAFAKLPILQALVSHMASIEHEVAQLSNETGREQLDQYLQKAKLGVGGISIESVGKTSAARQMETKQNPDFAPPSRPVDDKFKQDEPMTVQASASAPLRSWTLAKVQEWLCEIEMSEAVQAAFKENSVDGDLLADVTLEELTGDLGLTSLQAKRLFKLVNKLLLDAKPKETPVPGG